LINIVPSSEIISNWERDYKTMQESMFYGATLSFNELITRIKELNSRVKKI